MSQTMCFSDHFNNKYERKFHHRNLNILNQVPLIIHGILLATIQLQEESLMSGMILKTLRTLFVTLMITIRHMIPLDPACLDNPNVKNISCHNPTASTDFDMLMISKIFRTIVEISMITIRYAIHPLKQIILATLASNIYLKTRNLTT